MKKLILALLILITATYSAHAESIQAQQRLVDPGAAWSSRYEGGGFSVGDRGVTITRIELENAPEATPSVWITKADGQGYEENFACFTPPGKMNGFRITEPGYYYIRPSLNRHSAAGGPTTSSVVVYYTAP